MCENPEDQTKNPYYSAAVYLEPRESSHPASP
jgi:hypothetical protein